MTYLFLKHTQEHLIPRFDRPDVTIILNDELTNIPKFIRGGPTLWTGASLYEGIQAVEEWGLNHPYNDDNDTDDNKEQEEEQGKKGNTREWGSDDVIQPIITTKKTKVTLSDIESLKSRYSNPTTPPIR